MTGLILKDFYLLLDRKQTLVMFVAISVLMGYTMDGSFIVGYMCTLGAILALGTISYDEVENGQMFLLTLPVERKTYALSKYAIGGLVCGMSWILAVVLMLVMNVIKGEVVNLVEELVTALAILPVAALELFLLIPIQLKFGMEKSRLALALLGGGAAALLAIPVGRMGVPERAVESLNRIPVPAFVVLVVAVFVLGGAFSVWSSIRIMERKRF